MAVFALTNAYVYVAGHDFTGDSNQLALSMDVAALDRTTFRSGGFTELAGGLKTSTFNQSGFWQSATTDAVDVESFPDLGVVNRVHTVGQVETEGAPAYMWQGGKFSYALGGTLGELTPFTLSSQGTNGVGVVRGRLAKALGVVSAPAVSLGSPVNLGAVGAGQFLYATIHVFAGTSITVELKSDDNSSFSSPTVITTLPPISTRGGTWVTRIPGPIADTWFKFGATAVSGTVTVAGAIGIQ